MAPTTITDGQEAKVVFTVRVKTHLGEAVPYGEKVVVKVGSKSCTAVLHAGKGTCSLTNSELPAGSYGVSATYRGDVSLGTSSASAATKLTVLAKKRA